MAFVYKVAEREIPIYDDATGEQIYFDERKKPFDLEKGYKYPGQRQVGVEPEHIETVPGTECAEYPQGLSRLIAERPIYEDCEYYHQYTNEELIERYKAELAAMDYIGTKIATGRATIEEYAFEIAKMNVLAGKINELREMQ